MQYRMKTHQLNEEQIKEILVKSQVGHIATINENGYPYVVPVHFVYLDDKIYIHGLAKGQKIDNIMANEKVCFETYFMKGLILDESPWNVNTEYKSVVIMGKASIVEGHDLKEAALNKIVEKYTPNLTGIEFPDNVMRGTSVIEIIVEECTGKYYK
ncbi:MAG TPA: pyridoxamine 5'-phosphate oxidase family protein [Methanobacterium sp.]|nr:pyridoxamine 5'-phosphate oxidase family protein [Methanobacterium sp.]